MDEVYEVCSEGIAIVLDVYLRVNHFYLLFFFFLIMDEWYDVCIVYV